MNKLNVAYRKVIEPIVNKMSVYFVFNNNSVLAASVSLICHLMKQKIMNGMVMLYYVIIKRINSFHSKQLSEEQLMINCQKCLIEYALLIYHVFECEINS